MNVKQTLMSQAIATAVRNARAGQDALALDEVAQAISEGITDWSELRALADSLYDVADEIEEQESEDEDSESEEE